MTAPDLGNHIHEQQPQILQRKRRMIARPGWKLLDAVYPRNLETFARCFTPDHAPRSIVAVMRTVLLSSNKILRVPEPGLEVKGLTAASVDIELACRVADLSVASAARTELFDLAYRHARANGLLLAPSGIETSTASAAVHRGGDLLPPLHMLAELPLFRSLSSTEIETLASTVVARSYQPGDTLVDQDAVLRALVIIRLGTAIVTRKAGSLEVEVTRLSPGDSVGERGLLAGAGELGRIQALTTVLTLEIGEVAVQSLIHERPELANELASMLAQRSSVERMTDVSAHPTTDAPWLLSQIHRLFGVGSAF